MSNFWKEIQNYSGCTDFEQLQYYLNLIYKYQVQLEDFQTMHPVYLAKLLHIHQLAIQYYEHSTEELIEYEKYNQKMTQDIVEQIRKTEKKLLESKVNIKAAQKKLSLELNQKEIFMQKIINTQLIQCLYCDKVVTNESQFDLHMKQYHKGEFNKKEVNTINQALQNQLLTQQLSNKVIQQNQQNYIALNYQLLQFTKDQLSRETTNFMGNTLEVTGKIKDIDQTYTKEIKNLEEEISNKLNLIQLNAEKEEQIREQQAKEKVAQMEDKILQEFEKSKSHLLKSKQLNTMKNLGKSQESAVNVSQHHPSVAFYQSSQLHRGQTGIHIKSLANIEQDELIEDDQHYKTSLQQFKIQIKNPESDSHLQGQFEQSQLLSDSLQGSQRILVQPQTDVLQQSKFSKPLYKKNSGSEEDQSFNKNENLQSQDNIDYLIENLDIYRNAVESQQNMLFELLQNRNKGSRSTYTDIQKKHYRQILEKNIEQDLKGIEQYDLKHLRKIYDELNKQLKDQQANVDQKLQLYSLNEESRTPEDIDSLRATQFLNIKSIKNSGKNLQNLSQN
ncbi:unnamed protein product (macronuclear) [Paramecium tetraurelia]|uniref:C2H2-type domain-containing protein n=1 Tax=Paramecium tetraurelia TaxID=5888 RepID=A0EEZ2_PARTE|nr:uncharacterized protein GSPATT00026206001 [Paramecium tetraurelia]CAK93883.1 unnamed protein product [Paramecium tetraurelia]|eukprot:XP_001461256.1 hypothetical protein (macronuclear) [Paramecium tetraurelia strain d4-2]